MRPNSFKKARKLKQARLKARAPQRRSVPSPPASQPEYAVDVCPTLFDEFKPTEADAAAIGPASIHHWARRYVSLGSQHKRNRHARRQGRAFTVRGIAMSNRRPPKPKPPLPNDPNQGSLFTRIRARYANLDRLHSLSWKIAFAAFGFVGAAMWTKQNAASFPTFFFLTKVAGALLLGIWLTEIVRCLRSFETKILFVSIFILLSASSVAVAGFALWQIEAEWTATRQQEADARAAEKAEKAEKEKAFSEARKAEIAECEAQKKDLLGRLRRQRTEAENVFEACAADYRASKTIFTSQTVEERCRVQQTALDAVIRQHKLASAKQCNPDEKKQSARR